MLSSAQSAVAEMREALAVLPQTPAKPRASSSGSRDPTSSQLMASPTAQCVNSTPSTAESTIPSPQQQQQQQGVGEAGSESFRSPSKNGVGGGEEEDAFQVRLCLLCM